jgi:hypothetical protein
VRLARSLTSPKWIIDLKADSSECGEEIVDRKSDEEIDPFVRDGQSGRFLFNAKASQALGIDPAEARKRGYPSKTVAEATDELAAA